MSVSIWFVSPAWRRPQVTRLVLEQRQLVCDRLREQGHEAVSLIVADDENLDVAQEVGAVGLEHPNYRLGEKVNAGLRYACREGADWVVWIGSDDWIHPDVFKPLLDDPDPDGVPAIITGRRLATVNLITGQLTRVSSPSQYGAIPWLIHRRVLEAAAFQPLRPTMQNGLDGALIRGLRLCRAQLRWVWHDPHEFRCVDFKSGVNITSYERLTTHLAIAPEERAWVPLREHYPAGLVEKALRLHQQLRDMPRKRRGAAMPKLMHPETGKVVTATRAGAEVLRKRGYIDVTSTPPAPAPAAVSRAEDAPAPPPKIGKGSGRGAWAEYARSVGVEVTDEMSRAEIIAAVEQHEK